MNPVIPSALAGTLTHDIADYPDGIVLPIDKPYRWTSADVIRKVKFTAIKHFRKKNLKVGHAGTLDPLATGILLVCIGPATKRAEELQRSRKRYLAGVSFGATTPSYDLEKGIDCEYPLEGVSEAALRAVLPGFIGEQDQVAPLFSAKSVDGVYDSDPKTNPNAKKFSEISISEVVERGLGVVDGAAAVIAKENKMPMLVFELDGKDSIARAAKGVIDGTVVTV
jgi:tRNA pseudouridine(55) synthase